MKIAACDVCLAEQGKIVKAPWRFRVKSTKTGTSVSADVCEEHKKYFGKDSAVSDVCAVVNKAIESGK